MSPSAIQAQQPVLFVGHGNPMHAIDDNPFKLDWQHWGQNLRQQYPRPRAIVVVSAHWVQEGWYLTEHPQPPTIHDFYGFPQALYQQHYPALGAPDLLPELQALLPPIALQGDGATHGLDHGCWTVLMHLFPKADIPVVQLSFPLHIPLAQHHAAGQALAQLSQANILLIGSGNTVHNFDLMRLPLQHPIWQNAFTFDTQISQSILAGQHDGLYAFDSPAALQQFQHAHPTPEHYIPLLYAAGAGWGRPVQQRLIGRYAQAPVGMRCFQWG